MAVISNLSGDLLAYSNGLEVHDASHQLMLNGGSILGHQSAAQGAIFVPDPGDTNRFYLFTLDAAENGGVGGLRYSVVDMTLNGGLGAIDNSQKNVQVFSPCHEVLTVVANKAKDGYWILSANRQTNTFLVFELTSSGISSVPVATYNLGNWIPFTAKFSPDGSMFASSLASSGSGSSFRLVLFGFDNATGAITRRWTSNSGVVRVGHCEFSQDNTKLYQVEWSNPLPFALASNIYQFDLTAGGGTGIGVDTVAVKNSKTAVFNGGLLLDLILTIQLAPDCKIYFNTMSSQHLHAITQPNLPGSSCAVQMDHLNLSGHSTDSPFLLPNIVSSFLETPCDVHFVFDDLCFGQPTHFFLEGFCSSVDSVEWNFGDPASASNTSNAPNPQHIFSSAGVYEVVLTAYVGGQTIVYEDEIHIQQCNPKSNFTVSNTSVCAGYCVDFTDLSESHDTLVSWFWDFGNGMTSVLQNPTSICYPNPGIYTVTLSVSDIFGSADTTFIDYIIVDSCAVPQASFFMPDTICLNDCISLFDMSSGPPSSWQWTFDGSDSASSMLQNPSNICFYDTGLFEVTLQVANALGTDDTSMFIRVLPLPYVDAGADFTAFIGEEVVLNGSAGGTTVLWEPSSGLSCPTCLSTTTIPSVSTIYTLTYTDDFGCSASDRVFVSLTDEFVIGVPTGFTPNGDQVNDVLYVHGAGIKTFVLEVFNRFGQNVFRTDSFVDGWDGTYQGKMLNQSVYTYKLTYTTYSDKQEIQYGTITLKR